MTRPTDEQIKALRKGDVVTVRAVVHTAGPDGDGDVRVDISYGDQTDATFIKPSEIMTIEPREIKVGDRVRTQGYEGEVLCVYEDRAWVRYDYDGKNNLSLFDDDRLTDLERLT